MTSYHIGNKVYIAPQQEYLIQALIFAARKFNAKEITPRDFASFIFNEFADDGREDWIDEYKSLAMLANALDVLGHGLD